jgi:hypothetical protein
MYTAMSSQLRQWNVAFAPLYAETLTSNGRRAFIAATTLRVRALSTELASQRVCARDPSLPDFLDIKSREIVDLSKVVAADPSFLKSCLGLWDCTWSFYCYSCLYRYEHTKRGTSDFKGHCAEARGSVG